LSPLPATLFRCEIHAINVVGRMDGGLMLPQTIFLPVPFAPSTSAPSVGSRRLPLEAGSPADPHELAICGISSPDEVLQGRRKQSTGCRVRQLDDPEKTTRGQRKAQNDFDTRKENHADDCGELPFPTRIPRLWVTIEWGGVAATLPAATSAWAFLKEADCALDFGNFIAAGSPRKNCRRSIFQSRPPAMPRTSNDSRGTPGGGERGRSRRRSRGTGAVAV